MVFYLSAFLAYLRFEESRTKSRYLSATILFLLGLLTKTVVATLPGALLVLAWWRRGKISMREDVAPLLAWFALGLAAGLTTAWVERDWIGAAGADFSLTPLQHAVLAGRVAWFYLGKLLWPANLMFMYPRWNLGAEGPGQLLYPVAALAAFLAAWGLRRRSRTPLAVALFFVGSLFPALGFVNVYPFVYSYAADHFQYIASFGILTAFAAAAALVTRRLASRMQRGAVVVGYALPALLGILTFAQCGQYADAETLYRTTLAKNPSCWMCWNNLGMISLARGQTSTAMDQFQAALKINPRSAEAHNNVGNLLVKLGSVPQAVDQYEESIRLSPKYVLAHNNLGGALLFLGRYLEAKSEFETVLRLDPECEAAQANLKVALAMESDARPK